MPVEINDIDLDKFDKMFCLMKANISGFPDYAVEILLPFTDGVFVRHSWGSSTEHGFVPTRQDNGLWTLHAAFRYNEKVSLLPKEPQPDESRWCFKTVYAWRDITKTKTTEVSTMSINSDQPISAGNLKAALDGLTGGGSLLNYEVLIRRDVRDDSMTYTLSKPIYEFDVIVLAHGYSYDSPTEPTGEVISAKFIGRTNRTIGDKVKWPLTTGGDYKINGNTIRYDDSGYFPRFVIGIKLDF